jgi:hypothetical protein
MDKQTIEEIIGEQDVVMDISEGEDSFTISVIGNGNVDQLFAVVPKTTTERGVVDTVSQLSDRAIRLGLGTDDAEAGFYINERILSQYYIRYSASALREAGYETIGEYVMDNGGSPWRLDTGPVIQAVEHEETVDYLDTELDTIEFD